MSRDYIASFRPAIRSAARDVLKAVLEYYEDAARWTQGAYYRDIFGNRTSVAVASCACSVGAIQMMPSRGSSQDPVLFSKYNLAIKTVEAANQIPCLINFNDDPDRTIEEVREAFQKGIDLLDELEAHP